MSDATTFVDADAVAYLRGAKTIRDGKLVSLTLQDADPQPVARLIFEMYHERPVRVVTLDLRGLKEIAFNHDDRHSFYIVEMVKCLWLPSGEFYLSLDPYDEREDAPSDKDNNLFRASSVRMCVSHKT